MGFFSNSKSDDFKDKFAEFWSLLASYSYGELSSMARPKIETAFLNLIVEAKQFQDPFNETFKLYTNNSSIFGDKISIATGVAIANIAIDAVSQGHRLSNQIQSMVIMQAKSMVATYDGKQAIRKLIYQ